MTFQQAIDLLYSRLPVFQNQGKTALKLDLSRTYALLEILDNPHLRLKSVHIAGTNGKGSSAHAISAILQASGYKVGLYTSPHLKSFTERIRINGVPISEDDVVDFVQKTETHFDAIAPSFFEVTVAMAFNYFRNEAVDISVIETGLGGRLDSTNVIVPEVCLITGIAWDHADILGNTLEKIAREKAGIIKQRVPVVLGSDQPDILHVFKEAASAKESKLNLEALTYTVEREKLFNNTKRIRVKGPSHNKKIQLDLYADYFLKNIPGVLEVIEELRAKGWIISEDHVVRGLSNVVGLTGLKGRFQKIGDHPLTIADVSHNEQGIAALMEQINHMSFEKLRIIYGAVRDKEVEKIFKLMPTTAEYYLTRCALPRSMPLDELEVYASGRSYTTFPDVNAALASARKDSSFSDLILVTGSTFVVAEIEEL